MTLSGSLDLILKWSRYTLKVVFQRILLLLILACLGVVQAQSSDQPAQPETVNPKVAVVISGGVARGFAYLGAMQEMVEAGVPIDLIVGTSAGAMMGGLYSCGYSFDTIRELARELARNQSDLVRVSLPPVQGLLELTGFEFVYRELVGDIRLEDTSPPLAVMATELRPAPATALTRGSLADAVRASISLPLIFPVARFEGRYYVDGGLRNPLPADVARDLGASFVISVRGKPEGKTQPEGLLDVLSFTVYAVTGSMTPPQFDSVVPIKTFDTQYFDFGSADALWERGRVEARASLPQLLEQLRSKGVRLNPPGDPHRGNPENLEWRQRLERGLNLARNAPEPLAVAPQIEFPSTDTWGARPGQPDQATLGLGAQVAGGPLGPVSLGAGYVELLDRPGGSGFVRLGVRLMRGITVDAEFDPGRRPADVPWEAGITLRGLNWNARASVDALAAGLSGNVRLDAGDFSTTFGLEARFGYAPSLRLEGRLGLEYAIGGGPWFVRARALGGLSTGGAQGFSLGASSLMRAYPNDFLIAPQALVTNLEFGYRLNTPNLLSLLSAEPEFRVLGDLGFAFDANQGTMRPVWDLGFGVTLPGRWFGFLPFFLGLDFGFSSEAWGVSLFTRAPLP